MYSKHNLPFLSEKGLVFTDIFLDTVAKHISNKIITCNDKDVPWTSEVKTAIKRNSRVYRKWVTRGKNPNDRDKVRQVRNSTNKLIKEAKVAYYTNLGNKLSDLLTGQKHFWTAYKKITNKKMNSNIPPIIDDGFFISNYKKKADILTNTLQTNVLEMLMIVFYRILFPKPMHRYTMCL